MVDSSNELLSKMGGKIIKQVRRKFANEDSFAHTCKEHLTEINMKKVFAYMKIDVTKYLEKQKPKDELYE